MPECDTAFFLLSVRCSITLPMASRVTLHYPLVDSGTPETGEESGGDRKKSYFEFKVPRTTDEADSGDGGEKKNFVVQGGNSMDIISSLTLSQVDMFVFWSFGTCQNFECPCNEMGLEVLERLRILAPLPLADTAQTEGSSTTITSYPILLLKDTGTGLVPV